MTGANKNKAFQIPFFFRQNFFSYLNTLESKILVGIFNFINIFK